MMKLVAVNGSLMVLTMGWSVFQLTASPGGMKPMPETLAYHCSKLSAVEALAGVDVIEADEHRHVRRHRLGRAGLVAGRAVRARVVVGVSLVSCYAVSVVSQRLLDDRDLSSWPARVSALTSPRAMSLSLDESIVVVSGDPEEGDALVVVAGRVVVLTGRAPAVGALHGREDRGPVAPFQLSRVHLELAS